MNQFVDRFFKWYDKHLTLNLAIASVLFSWQLLHLFWLFADVIVPRLFGYSLFPLTNFWQKAIILVDYTEIPALVTTGLFYVNILRKGYDFKSALFIVLLVSQLFHMFWITDTFVVTAFTRGAAFVAIPPFFAWIAILIDYLEVPAMMETFGRLWSRLAMRLRIKD